jgi:hypothetical protein
MRFSIWLVRARRPGVARRLPPARRTHTVTITQSEGGAIDANPKSGAAGTTVTLTNAPQEGYVFDHYTVDGERIDGDAFALNGDATASGVFNAETPRDTVITIDNLGADGPKAVNVKFDSSGTGNTVSLAYVHYVREALKAAGATGAISVSAPAEKFTPHFDGKDWWTSADLSNQDLYAAYDPQLSNGQEMSIMDGIKLSRDSSGKYVFVYDRELTVSRIVWQNSKEYGSDGPTVPFHGFGLKKGREVFPIAL